MEKLNGLIALLGEENEKKIKNGITDLIIERVADDLKEYDECNYILNPDEIIDFIDECKRAAFERVKEDVINNMVEKIKVTMKSAE